MKHIFTGLLTLCLALTASAQAPQGYYSKLNGISQPMELKTAVHDIIYPHSVPQPGEYNNYYYQSLPVFFRQTDTYPESDKWWDMYANINLHAPSMKGLNREHSFPKSWWGGNTDIPPYVDLNHLYPAEAKANQAKSNYPLGEVSMSETVKFNNGVSKVGYPVYGQGAGAKYVFEPDDEYKGDFARTYFYMVTCYQDLTWRSTYSWMLQSNTYPTLAPWAQELLLRWSREDPVSQKEIDRNNAVYRIQNNRNPFIDLPGLEEFIWGDKKYQEFKVTDDNKPGEPQLFSPVDGMSLDFSDVAVGNSTRSMLLFNGTDLTGSISVIITGADRSMFSIDQSTIPSSLINSDGGYYLPVTYKPTATGSHTAGLTVFDITGWGAGSLNVILRGNALDVPRLSKIKVLPASDVTDNSYIANWEAPLGETVDYYVVSRTHQLPDGSAETLTYEAETNSLLIEGYTPGLYDYYTVQSVRLGYRSEMSDAEYVTTGGIQGVEADSPLAVEVYGTTVRFICGNPIENATVYDISGRIIRSIPVIERNLEIDFAPGVYIIAAPATIAPVTVLVR